MKLNDTALYLSLIRSTLEHSILPELQTPGAKGAAGLITNVLNELARREDALPPAIDKTNAEGEHIAADMRALLKRPAVSTTTPMAMPTNTQSFRGPATTFAALSADIADLAKALRDEAGKDSATASLLRRAAEWEANAHTNFIKVPAPELAQAAVADPLPLPALQSFLRGVHPAGERLNVISIHRIPGGFGKQTYMVEIDDGSGNHQPLVIRKNDRIQILHHSSAGLEREFNLLKVVHAAGYPAPNPLWFGKAVPGIDADFMVVEKLPGSVIGAFLGGGADARIPESQMLLLAELLARLHTLDLDAFAALTPQFEDAALLTDTVEQCTRRTMAGWRKAAEDHGYLPSPLMDYLFNWLADNVPQDQRRPVLAHGDFGSHNILMDDGKVTAVLDWEGSMFAAPEMDLVYAQPLVSKHIEWDRFLAHYIACGGRAPDAESMNYYMTFLSLRVILVGNVANRNLQSGISNDIRYAMFELGLTPHFMQQTLATTADKP